MANAISENHCDLWGDAALPGVLMLRANFSSHDFAPHVHDELVIAVTEKGGAEFTSRGIDDLAEEGTTLLFNPGEPHAGSMGNSTCWRYRAFYLDAGAMQRLAEDLELPRHSLPGVCVNKLKDRELSTTLQAIHAASERDGCALTRQGELVSAMGALFSRYGSPKLRTMKLGDERSRIRQVIEYLSTHYAEQITLQHLASLTGMSAFHLVRSFKKKLGLPPHIYLTQLRLQAAKRHLAHGSSLAHTAAAVGFYDQSALCRHFKQTYGVTPGQYARAMM